MLPVSTAGPFEVFCMCGKCILFVLWSLSGAGHFERYLFFSAPLRKVPAHGALSEICAKLFLCTADKRKGEIDYLNYSQASDLSSFKRGFSVIAAYFTLRKHRNFSPGSLKLPKPFDKSFSPSDMGVKWLCAWAFILLY